MTSPKKSNIGPGKNGYRKYGIIVLLLFTVAVGIYGISVAASNPISSLSVSPNPVKLGTNTYINYALTEGSYMFINVCDQSGTPVRTVVNNVYKVAGSYYVTWDGKDNGGVNLVPDGIYTVKATAKDSTGAVLGQAEAANVIAARAPAITGVSDTPDPFNPASQQSVISFNISSRAAVTVTIFKGYTTVRTLVSNVVYDAGPVTVNWDGRDGLGNLQSDAQYTYQIDAASTLAPTIKTTYKTNTYINIETGAPRITGFSAATPVKIGTNSYINYTLSENAQVSLKVKNSLGVVVKTILNNAAKNAGANSSTWNGTNDSGAPVPEGTYTVAISAVDNVGNASSEQTASVVVGYVPVTSGQSFAPNPYNPNDPVNGTATIGYTLSDPADLNIQILKGYTVINTIYNGRQPAGLNSVTWNGKDSNGQVVGDGLYTYQIIAASPTVGTFTNTFKGTFTVEKGPPSVTGITATPDPFKLYSGNMTISYNLSENATVSITVFNGTTPVRNLVVSAAKNTGYNSAAWDGKDDSGNVVAEGTYRIVVSATATGGTGSAEVSVTAGYHPAVTGLGHQPEPFNPGNGAANFNFTLDKSAKVTATILNGYTVVKTVYSDSLMAAGSWTFTWDGTDNSGNRVNDGSYTYQVDAASPTVATFKSTVKGTVTLESTSPEITNIYVTPTPVKIGTSASFRYTLSEAATVNMAIYSGDTEIRRFPAVQKTAGGSFSQVWDTNNDQGTPVVPGAYTLKFAADDSSGKTGYAEFQFTAGEVPVITNVSATPAAIDASRGQQVTIAGNISVKSHVTVKLYDSANKVWRTLASNVIVEAGPISFTWDGIGDNSQYKIDTFTFRIDASSFVGAFKAVTAIGTVDVTNIPAYQPTKCTDCHLNYPVPHSMTQCALCHGNNRPIGDCASCHTGMTPHTDGSLLNSYQCSYCHTTTYPDIPSHPADMNGLHTGTLSVDCQQCHEPALNIEHPRHKDTAGNVLTCNICHGDTASQTVKDAVYNRQKDCAACHASINHDTVHNNPVFTALTKDTDMDCSLCHNSIITQEHLIRKDSAGINYTCATCHNSTRPEVTAAIAARNLNCEACHIDPATNTPTFHTLSGSPLHDTSYVMNPEVNCGQCHNGNIKTEHIGKISSTSGQPINCNTCHASIDPLVILAVSAGNTSCSACHTYPTAKHNPVHTTNIYTTDTTRTDAGTCATCHTSKSLTTLHVGQVNSVTGLAMDCNTCHASIATNVINAITTKSTNSCEACHAMPPAKHQPEHLATSPGAATLNCSECHNLASWTGANADVAGVHSGNCNTCHASTNSIVSTFISGKTGQANSVYNCEGCHVTGGALTKETVHQPEHMAQHSATNMDCSTCHTFSLAAATPTDITSATIHKNGCSTCHSGATTTVAQQNAKLFIAGAKGTTNPVYACEDCHVAIHLGWSDKHYPVFPADPNMTCADCHNNYLPTEHTKYSGNGDASTCVLCHGVDARADVKAAVAAKNTNCSACHTIHADINIAHTGNALPTTPWVCGTCHSNVLSIEHSSNAILKQNAGMNCDTCHKSTLAKVQAAVNSTAADLSNVRCEACHTGTADGVPAVHADIAQPHLIGIFPLASDSECLNCHPTQAGEFTSGKGGYHVVNNLTSKAAAGYGSYLTPWTSTSVVGCQGCHGNLNDGKAQAANILKRPYTYTSNSSQTDMLCFLCHNRSTYGGGGSGNTGFSSGGTNYHNIGDHKVNNVVQCSWCHAAVPHGTDNAHLVVTSNEPNSTGNLLTNFYHPASGQYRVSSCGSNTSACDEHNGY